jgi:hypothetical protein
VRVQKVIAAQLNFGLVENGVIPDRVVEVGIRQAERANNALVMVLTVVDALLADSFIEEVRWSR